MKQAHITLSKGWHSMSLILAAGSWKQDSSWLLHGFISCHFFFIIFLYSSFNHVSFTLFMFLFCFRRSISACFLLFYFYLLSPTAVWLHHDVNPIYTFEMMGQMRDFPTLDTTELTALCSSVVQAINN